MLVLLIILVLLTFIIEFHLFRMFQLLQDLSLVLIIKFISFHHLWIFVINYFMTDFEPLFFILIESISNLKYVNFLNALQWFHDESLKIYFMS